MQITNIANHNYIQDGYFKVTKEFQLTEFSTEEIFRVIHVTENCNDTFPHQLMIKTELQSIFTLFHVTVVTFVLVEKF